MRREADLVMASMPMRFDALEARVIGIEKNTRSLVEGIQSATSFWAFMTKWGKRFAVFMKYVGYVAAAGAAVYAFAEHIAQFDIVNWRRK